MIFIRYYISYQRGDFKIVFFALKSRAGRRITKAANEQKMVEKRKPSIKARCSPVPVHFFVIHD